MPNNEVTTRFKAGDLVVLRHTYETEIYEYLTTDIKTDHAHLKRKNGSTEAIELQYIDFPSNAEIAAGKRLMYAEKLNDEAIRIQIEQNLSMLIAEKYQQNSLPTPIPYLVNGKFKYHDPRAQKYADHLRDGIQLLTKTLDDLE